MWYLHIHFVCAKLLVWFAIKSPFIVAIGLTSYSTTFGDFLV